MAIFIADIGVQIPDAPPDLEFEGDYALGDVNLTWVNPDDVESLKIERVNPSTGALEEIYTDSAPQAGPSGFLDIPESALGTLAPGSTLNYRLTVQTSD